VEPKAVEPLAAAIKQLLLNQSWAKQLGEQAAQHVQQFTWDRNVRAYLELYQQVLRKTGKADHSGRLL